MMDLLSIIYSQYSFLVKRLLHQPQNIFEIGILSILIYYGILFVRGTRVVAVLRGALLLLALFLASEWFELHTINILFDKLANVIVFSFIVLFAPELRRALIAIGRQTFARRMIGSGSYVQPIQDALRTLTQHHIGALIAVERTVGLRGYTRSGEIIDAEISDRILCNIFHPKAPLHDGGVIIEHGRILAAACIFPLSSSPLSHLMGTRHRAALGLSEETDALIICVSEETSEISIFENGTWDKGVSVMEVAERLAKADM